MILPSTAATSLATVATTTTIDALLSSSHAVTPTAAHSASSAPGGGGGISYPENWNSIIGIVTAIVGNIMISFALNMQRYAHIRLEREWQEKEKRRKRRYRSRSYDNEREENDAKRRNGSSDIMSESVDDEYADAATEHDPLLAGSGTGGRRASARGNARPRLNSIGEEDEGAREGQGAHKMQSYLKSPYWWAGIILMTTGEAGNFLAYGFAPASIVSPLGVVALISNCIIAPIMLKEPYRKRDGLGVLIAVAGAVTVVLSASDDNPKLGPDEIWDLIRRWEFETYLGITVAVIAVLMVASNRFGDKNILVDLGLVGLFGGYTALSTKGVASMLSYTLWRAITFPVTYLLVAILIGTAIMQIKYVNRALQRFDATQVIPVQFVLFTLSVILGSAILYRDFERTSGSDAGKFVGGCAMTFLGVWLITSGRPPRSSHDDEEDRDPEPEDAISLVGEPYTDDVVATSVGSIPASRRSSTLRATSPPMDIANHTSTRAVSQANTPDIVFTPQNSISRAPTNDIPSPMTQNPWDEQTPASHSSSVHPENVTRHTTVSTPALPSYAIEESHRPSTSSPDLGTTSHPNPPRPSTPVRNASDTAAMTTTPTAPNTLPPRLRRMGSSAGRNMTHGPLLASPLSTSLSAMVADFKRGGSGAVRDRATRGEGGFLTVGPVGEGEAISRRRQSAFGGFLGGPGEVQSVGGDVFGEALDRRRTAGEERVGRGRSLSGTLGELWRGIRRGGEEAGNAEVGYAEGDRR